MGFQEKIIKKVTGETLPEFKELLKEKFDQIDQIQKDITWIKEYLTKQ